MIDPVFLQYLFRAILVWPAVVISIALSVYGVTHRVPGYIILAAVLVLPHSYMLWADAHYPAIVVLVPLLPAGAAVAVHSRKALVAWLLLLPYIGLFGLLFLRTVIQQ